MASWLFRLAKDISRLNPIVLAGRATQIRRPEAGATAIPGGSDPPTSARLTGAPAVPQAPPVPPCTSSAVQATPYAPPGFESVGGLCGALSALREMVLLPLLYPELLAGMMGASPPGGILLYGPPGTGKTLLARCGYVTGV